MATHYLVSNFREMLSILESLRVSKQPGRGMRHLAPRPIIEGSLRTSEASLITVGKDGEFPILLEVEPAEGLSRQGRQADAISLSRVMRVVFQSESHRDIALHRSFENASFDTLESIVDAKLFDADGEARFSRLDVAPSGGEIGWQKADWFCGGLAGALEATRIHPEINGSSIAQFLTSHPARLMQQALDQAPSEGSTLDILVQFFAQNSGSGDLYGEELLESTVDALERGGAEVGVLEAFKKHVHAILASDIARKSGELTDEGDVALRALSILILRPTTVDVLEDRIADQLPGKQVFVTAALLSGVREGLARLPWVMKAKNIESLGEIGSQIENDRDVRLLVADSIKTAVASAAPDRTEFTDATNSDLPAAHQGSVGNLRFEICNLSSKAAAGRALNGLAEKPARWRIICDEDEMLHLLIELTGSDDLIAVEAEARKTIRSWKKRTSSKRSSKEKNNEPTTGSDTLPGLLDQR